MILVNTLTRGKGGKVRKVLDEGAEADDDGVKAGKKAKKKVRAEPMDLEEQLALEEAKGGAGVAASRRDRSCKSVAGRMGDVPYVYGKLAGGFALGADEVSGV